MKCLLGFVDLEEILNNFESEITGEDKDTITISFKKKFAGIDISSNRKNTTKDEIQM